MKSPNVSATETARPLAPTNTGRVALTFATGETKSPQKLRLEGNPRRTAHRTALMQPCSVYDFKGMALMASHLVRVDSLLSSDPGKISKPKKIIRRWRSVLGEEIKVQMRQNLMYPRPCTRLATRHYCTSVLFGPMLFDMTGLLLSSLVPYHHPPPARTQSR